MVILFMSPDMLLKVDQCSKHFSTFSTLEHLWISITTSLTVLQVKIKIIFFHKLCLTMSTSVVGICINNTHNIV